MATVRVLAIGDAGKNIVAALPPASCPAEIIPVPSLAGAEALDPLALQADSPEGAPLILVAGLGGQTGTKGALLLAERARAAGLFTLALIITPCSLEGEGRVALAQEALQQLRQRCDGLLNFDNDLLCSDRVSQRQVFSGWEALNGQIARCLNRLVAAVPTLDRAHAQRFLDGLQP